MRSEFTPRLLAMPVEITGFRGSVFSAYGDTNSVTAYVGWRRFLCGHAIFGLMLFGMCSFVL